jgi:MFS family permease
MITIVIAFSTDYTKENSHKQHYMTPNNYKKWNTILGWSVFTVALTVYLLTVEPTLSFWDSGEYIATSAKLQVGHPPGAPLFQMTGAFFAMFATSPDKIALMVNLVSVLSSACTILFMFWSSTILLRSLTHKENETDSHRSMVLGSAFIGCLTFIFSDSFWFNAVETEVYAMASLFIALLLWAGLRWGEEMHTARGNRWLLLIALLTGLSFGVHFLALLTIPSIGLIYYFKNYKTVTIKNFIVANIAIVGVLFFVFKFLLPYTLALFAKTELFMVNTLGMPFNSGTVFMFVMIGAAFWFGLRYTVKKKLPLYNTALLCILFIMIGFSSWIMLPVRSNANVSINENRPSDATEVLAYYNMEQYGEKKVFYGPSYTETYAGLDSNTPFEDGKPNYERDYKTGKYVIVNNYKNAKQNFDDKHSGIFPRMMDDKSAAQYMAFTGPPKFKIDPAYDFGKDLKEYGIDVNTLNEEEIYRASEQIKSELENVIAEFRAAYDTGKVGNEEYDKFLQAYKQYLVVEKPTFGDNMQFMAEYQFGYMYWRYLMWNFAGRQNDIQGEYNNNGEWLSGIKAVDEARLGEQDYLPSDALNNKGRNVYYFIPLLLGIIGAIYHARKNPKSFYILLTLFLFTSFALKIFLNEKPFEVRERDYVLVGSFYAFAIWIGIGVYAIHAALKRYVTTRIAMPAVLASAFLCAPLLMAKENWDDHDRSGKYTAIAMAKAYLDSCEPNAILFSIGDNDTFPLWYAQEIEGYRTDVRVACSTFLPTDWYIDQLKTQVYDSTPLPITFKHEQYRDGTRDYMLYNPKTEARMDSKDFIAFLALDDERAKIEFENGQKANYYPTNKVRLNVDRTTVINNKVVSSKYYDSIVPYIDINLPDVLYKHNMIMLDIVFNNNWKRPIHFTGGSMDDENYIWMKDYLQLHGMTYKLVPVKTPVPEDNPIEMGYVDSEQMYDTVMKWDWGNGSSPNIYHDPETRRNSITYRKNLARLSDTLIKEGKMKKAEKIIDLAVREMPLKHYGYYFMHEPFADGYYKVGRKKDARKILDEMAMKYREHLTYYDSLDRDRQSSNTYAIIREIESYRNVLLIMQDNNDIAFYNKHKEAFNKHNKMFPLLRRENL